MHALDTDLKYWNRYNIRGYIMRCRDEVASFIIRYSISGYLKSFLMEVKSVELAVEATGGSPSEIAKTLIIRADEEYVAVIIPGDRRLDLSKVAKLLNSRTARLAKPEEVKDITGFEVGEVSPLSECVRSLRILIDPAVLKRDYVWCGGGSTHLLAYVSTHDLVRVLNPLIVEIT